MECCEAREALLQAEDPGSPAADVAQHLSACAACQSLAAELVGLEQAWKHASVLADAEPARLRFLERLASSLPVRPNTRVSRGQHVLIHWAVAALLLVAVGIGIWSLISPPHASAASTLIEELVDWNLQLASANSTNDRSRIHTAREARFTQAVDQTSLPAEERELASLLLDNGNWLARNDDPIDTAERFSTLADKFLERVKRATAGRDERNVKRYARLQQLVAQHGVSSQLGRAEENGVLNFDMERRLKKLILRDSKRMQVLVGLLEQHPNLKRRDIRQALGLPTRSPGSKIELTIDIEAPTAPVMISDPVRYQFTLHNSGNQPVWNMRILVEVPEQMEFLTASGADRGRQQDHFVLYRFMDGLAPGASTSCDLTLKPIEPGTATLSLELRAKQLGYDPILRQVTTVIADTVP